MASLITSRFYESWVPKTWLTPKITAILEEDSSIVVNTQDMTEVGGWFYKYEFEGYNASKLYFFSIDWGATLADSERYIDSINELDSYGNKQTRGKRQELIIDPQAIAEEVRDAKTKSHSKKGTFGETLQTPISFEWIVSEINLSKSKLEEIIKEIKLPKWITKADVYETIEDSMDKYMGEPLQKWVKEALDRKENEREPDDKYSDEQVVAWIENLAGLVANINDKIESVKEDIAKDDLIEKLKGMDIDKVITSISTATEKRKDINDKHDKNLYSLDTFNNNMMWLRNTMKNLFTRLSMK